MANADDIDHLSNLIESLDLILDEIKPTNPTPVFSEQQLDGFQNEMERIQFQEDKIHEQQSQFSKKWAQIQRIIGQGDEQWRIANLNKIDKIYSRAYEINQQFEREIERKLLDEPSELDESSDHDNDEKWSEMCDDTRKGDDQSPNTSAEANNSSGAPDGTVDPPKIQPTTDKEQNPNVIEQKTEMEVDDHEHKRFEPTSQENLDSQQVKSNEQIKDELKAASAAAKQQLGSQEQKSAESDSDDHINVLTTPMELGTPGSFTIHTLMNYGQVSNILMTFPNISEPLQTTDFRAMNSAVATVITFVNTNKLKWSNIEPMVMAKVICRFPPSVLTQWALQTMNGPATFLQLRKFLASYESFLKQGWLENVMKAEQSASAEESSSSRNIMTTSQKEHLKDQQALYSSMFKTSGGAVPKATFKKPKNNDEEEWDDQQPLPKIVRTSSNSSLKGNYSPRFNPNAAEWNSGNSSNKKSMPYNTNQKSFEQNKPERKRLTCLGCGDNHALIRCPLFKDMTLTKRKELVKKRNICVLCLGAFHNPIACSNGTCEQGCSDAMHNSLLCPISEQKRRQAR